MRVSVTSGSTTDEDADRTIEAVCRAWRTVRENHDNHSTLFP